MKSRQIPREEREYLKNYNIANFERPSVAADIAAFSVMEEGEQDNFRKLPEKTLKLLLIRRASYPYKNNWSLPGGFCQQGEDVEETARRELREETNVESAYFEPVGIYGKPGRDPRGWIISNTFLALLDGEKCMLRADDDAWEAQWFTVKLTEDAVERKSTKKQVVIRKTYRLTLSCPEVSERIFAVVREERHFENFHESAEYELLESGGLGFDHGKIIVCSLLALRKLADEKVTAIFDLMPEKFTLTQLQQALEAVLDRKLLTANYRRKIADYVTETDEWSSGQGHRPAKLFERNVEAFYR